MVRSALSCWSALQPQVQVQRYPHALVQSAVSRPLLLQPSAAALTDPQQLHNQPFPLGQLLTTCMRLPHLVPCSPPAARLATNQQLPANMAHAKAPGAVTIHPSLLLHGRVWKQLMPSMDACILAAQGSFQSNKPPNQAWLRARTLTMPTC